MDYEEAEKLALNTYWETKSCGQETCWCKMIKPTVNITYDDVEDYYIVGAGAIDKKIAEYIVKLHNDKINNNRNNNNYSESYFKLLKSGMFFEFHPELSGTYEVDEEQWVNICENNKKTVAISWWESLPKSYKESYCLEIYNHSDISKISNDDIVGFYWRK